MSKQSQTTEAKADTRRQSLTNNEILAETGGIPAALEAVPIRLFGVTVTRDQLIDPKLQAVQRQKVVTQVGRLNGNQYLQRVVTPNKHSKEKSIGNAHKIMRQERSSAVESQQFDHDRRAIQVRDAPPEITRAIGPGGYFLIDPESEGGLRLLPSNNSSREIIFNQARRRELPVFQYTPGEGPSFAEAVSENQPQFVDELAQWIGYANLEISETGGRSGGVPAGQSPDSEGSRLGQSVYLIMSILDMGASSALKGALRRFARRAIPALRRAARRTGLTGLEEVANKLERRISDRATETAAEKGVRRTIRIVDQEDGFVTIAGEGPAGEILVLAEMTKEGDSLILRRADIQGPGLNSFGVAEMRAFIREFGRQQGVKNVIIEGAPRTTGATLGRRHRFSVQIE